MSYQCNFPKITTRVTSLILLNLSYAGAKITHCQGSVCGHPTNCWYFNDKAINISNHLLSGILLRVWYGFHRAPTSECRLEGFGRHCFAYAAPSLWNPLPTPVKRASSIDTFKSSLKTYLFNVVYPSIHWILYCMSILFVAFFNVFYLQAFLSTVTSHHFWN